MQEPSPFPGGILTATITPMDRDLKADTRMLSLHCRRLLQNGCDGIVLLGTTGEANSFSLAERKEILDAAIDDGLPPELLMVGTGCCALTDTIELSRHALQLGIRNVLMLPPFYYKPVTDEALFTYYTRVLDQIGDDKLRVYLYHIPQNTGVPLTPVLISRLLEFNSTVIAGIKDSGGDWGHTQMLIREFPTFRVYSGSEEYLLDTLQSGGAGSISATANVTISTAARVVSAYRNGDDARALQQTLTSMRLVFKGYPFVGVLKGFLAEILHTPSLNYLRPPNENLDPMVVSSVVQRIRELANPL